MGQRRLRRSPQHEEQHEGGRRQVEAGRCCLLRSIHWLRGRLPRRVHQDRVLPVLGLLRDQWSRLLDFHPPPVSCCCKILFVGFQIIKTKKIQIKMGLKKKKKKKKKKK